MENIIGRLFFLLLVLEFQLQAFFSSASASKTANGIKYLPGFDGPLPFYLETGYIGLGEAEEVQLFYYFVKSERNPEQDPLILWLTGGPGCSSFSGLAFEIGPVRFKVVEYNGSLPTLVLNPDSWTKVSSIIFLDLPVGAGFSYATSEPASRSSDKVQASQAVEFMRKWLKKHPKFQTNQFYIGGDSYAGIPLPIAAQSISNENEVGIKPIFNLKGYILGNPLTNFRIDDNSKISTAHGLTLISDELYQSLKTSCGEEYHDVDPTNHECINNLDAFQECLSGLYTENILYPKCAIASPKPIMEEIQMDNRRRFLWDRQQSLSIDVPTFGCPTYPYLLSDYWANDVVVRKALHVRKDTVQRWIRCNYRLNYNSDVSSSFKYHVHLSTKGYRSLIYSGDHDMVVPSMGTQAWIRALNYSIVEDWRSWHVDGQVGGYTRTYSNGMTFATVKGAGHIAVAHKPLECSVLFKKWINQEPL
ncbi:unnamed protein product [Linum trigynum]|uniref:Uncharacterized protein n=1 Tax=Linum trigynum TaxID=586398 RepID=A0AAV2FDJ0_9ROSI